MKQKPAVPGGRTDALRRKRSLGSGNQPGDLPYEYFQRFLGEEKAGGDAMRLTKYAAMSLAAVMVMSTGAYAAETTEAETEEAGSAAESEAESEEETEPEIGGETEYPVQ